jgi:hypothetical protein
VAAFGPKRTRHTFDIVVTAKPANETKLPFGPLLQRDFGDFQQFFPAGAAAIHSIGVK